MYKSQEKSSVTQRASSWMLSAVCLVALSACTTVPVVMKFPSVPPQLMEPPVALKPVGSSTESSKTTVPATKTQKN